VHREHEKELSTEESFAVSGWKMPGIRRFRGNVDELRTVYLLRIKTCASILKSLRFHCHGDGYSINSHPVTSARISKKVEGPALVPSTYARKVLN